MNAMKAPNPWFSITICRNGMPFAGEISMFKTAPLPDFRVSLYGISGTMSAYLKTRKVLR